jgi:3',5'-cyclic AMP phosphodiesterase CpdA
MVAERPSIVIHTGDVAYFNGTFSQYDRYYFAYYQGLMADVPFFLTPGNHDCETNNAEPFLALHSFPVDSVPFSDRGRYYSFDWGNVHFISIDSSLSLEAAINRNGPMLQWLETDLRSTKQFWRIAIIHHAPYSSGPNEQEVTAFWARTYVVPILEAYGVQVVFSGEEHSYQRSYSVRQDLVVPDGCGIVYFTTGGGGAGLYPVDPSNPRIAFGRSEHHYLRVEVNGMQMAVRAIRQDGSEIDRFIVAPCPILAADTAGGEPVTFYPSPDGRTLMRISGHSLASEEMAADASSLPDELGGTSVLVNGRAAHLIYVATNQIYAEVPNRVTGTLTVRVVTPNGSVDTTVIPSF